MSEKSGFGSNSPYANMNEDEKLARKLQEEEDARAGRYSGDGRGLANNYYHQPPQPGGYEQHNMAPYAQGGQPSYQGVGAQEKSGKSKGLLGKLLGKATGGSSSSAHGYPPQHQSYGQPLGYGGGGYQQRPMGMPMGGGMMGGGRRPGGGMGAGGAMALGAGGGLLGGALLGSALADGGDGGDYGGDGGGDFGGGDMGGGDMGGGDFGGD